MLDSGAFSAWKKGERIELRSYIEFIQSNLAFLHSYVSLDVIPGRLGGRPTQTEIDAAALESFKNYEQMCAADLHPIPVFHFGEREDWLRRILDSGAEWIGLGGSVGRPDEARYQFFARSFRIIADSGRRVRVHGFGATSAWHVLKYPWYSVDSTSWVMPGINGRILVPAATAAGTFDYRKLTVVEVSGRGKLARQAAGLGDILRAHLEAFLASENTSLAEVRSDQAARNRINISCFKRRVEALGVRLFFSTWLRAEVDQALQLTAAGVKDRLLSYYELRGGESSALQEYVVHGAYSARPQLRAVDRRFSQVEYRAYRISALVARGDVLGEAGPDA
jgi:hypothetical protein